MVFLQITEERTKLSNGYIMPKLAFGTYGLPKNGVETVIADALKAGYRHFETAPIYQNEEAIGNALKKSGLDRDTLFITSKIPPHIKTYEGTVRVLRRTMKKLDVDFLDLVLINNPVPWGKEGQDFSKENREVWRALETFYLEETVGVIGLSNFDAADMKALMRTAQVKPHVNQIGVFAGHTLDDVRTFCQRHAITVQGHSPLARGRLLRQTWLKPLAEKEGITVPQMLLRFVYELGVMPVVKSSDMEHMKENISIEKPLSRSTFDRLKAFEQDVRDYGPPNATSQL